MEKTDVFADAYFNRPDGKAPEENFRDYIGIEITERKPGYAKGQIEIQPRHLNRLGIIHGGVLFSLADTISGTAAMTGHTYAVPTVNGTINYLRGGHNTKRIVAEAREIKNGHAFSVCDCSVYDDEGNLLVTTTTTFYHLQPK